MKIAHVVSYVDPDGSYGGPTTVAFNQAKALGKLGHEVTVYAGSPDRVARERDMGRFVLKTFPARVILPRGGFAFLNSMALLAAVRRARSHLDIAHVHIARDLLSLPAAVLMKRAGVPLILQTHGMIDASSRLLAKPLDRWAVTPLLAAASRVLTLTEKEDADIKSIAPSARTARIVNGIESGTPSELSSRPDMVLFLARLHPRKRPLAFIRMAVLLRDELPSTRFVLAGPDEGEGAAVRAAIADSGMADRIEWIGPVSPEQAHRLFDSARAYVLPSVDEVFPMTILESLRAGTPVITTDSLGIAHKCSDYGAAVLTDGSSASLAKGVAKVCRDPAHAEALRAGGAEFLESELQMDSVGRLLDRFYASAQSGEDAADDV